jgi:hypothetical protein
MRRSKDFTAMKQITGVDFESQVLGSQEPVLVDFFIPAAG